MFWTASKKINIKKSHPGPAKYIGRAKSFLDYVLTFFLFLTLFSIVLCFIQNNQYLFITSNETLVFLGLDILKIKWIDYETSMALFAGIFALFFARFQFALSNRPVLNYLCRKKNETESALKKGTHLITTIKNEGNGVGIVIESQYRIAFNEEDLKEDYVSYSDVEKLISKELNLKRNDDYWLTYFSSGWTFGLDSRENIFEMKETDSKKIFALDIKIKFSGILGDEYVKEVYCIPRPYNRV